MNPTSPNPSDAALSLGSLNQASEAIGRDIPNTAAQAELLRAEQLSLQHNAQLAFYAQVKAQQIDTLQAALQTALHNQVAKLAAIEHHAPAWPANRQTRSTWQNQLAQAKTRLAQLERRSERVGEIASGAGLYADSLLDELAARKLRFRDLALARQWDALLQQQRKAALQKHHSAQCIELDQGRTRSLGFSTES
jgi:flagellar biosynthesis chaperone FliJ